MRWNFILALSISISSLAIAKPRAKVEAPAPSTTPCRLISVELPQGKLLPGESDYSFELEVQGKVFAKFPPGHLDDAASALKKLKEVGLCATSETGNRTELTVPF